MKEDEEKFEVTCEKKDGEIGLRVFEIQKEHTWVVEYSFEREKGKTFYSLKEGISLIGGIGVSLNFFFTVLAPTLSLKDRRFAQTNVYVNFINGTFPNVVGRILKMGNVAVRKMTFKGRGFQSFGKLFLTVQVPEDSKGKKYTGMITITLERSKGGGVERAVAV